MMTHIYIYILVFIYCNLHELLLFVLATTEGDGELANEDYFAP